MPACPSASRVELAEATGILMASGLGGTNTLIDQIATCRIDGPSRVSPFFIPMAIANMAAGVAGIMFGALGPNYSTTSACASSGHALGESYEIIKRGDAERHGRRRLRGARRRCHGGRVRAHEGALHAQRRPRGGQPAVRRRPRRLRRRRGRRQPSSSRSWTHAQRRGARIYAEVCGYGATADGHHITTPSPGGAGAVRAARRALHKAGLEPSRHRPRQRPCHQHRRGRPHRADGHQRARRRPRRQRQRHRHQVIDRPHARRGRGRGRGGHGQGARGRRRAAHAEPARARRATPARST